MKYDRPNRTAKVRNILGRTGIYDKPEEANSRRSGDRETDTTTGRNGKGTILTLTERSTDFILVEKPEHVSGFSAMYTVMGRPTSFSWRNPDTAGRPHTRREPQSGCRCRIGDGVKAMRTDNGGGFPAHGKIMEAMKGIAVCFADPYSSW